MCSTKHSDGSCTVVTVNSGSTSVKLAAFTASASGAVTQISHDHLTGEKLVPREILRGFLAKLPALPDVIAHRVVHGGRRFPAPVRLHNPKALEWIEAASSVAGANVIQIAAFDTSFFSSLPRVAQEYAIAAKYGVDEEVRRYGFHGLAHEALWRRWTQLRPDLPGGGRVITLQLGGGASIAAIDRGQPLDTSMGFSPLEGLVMGTRSGDLDPAVVPYLQKRLRKDSDAIVALLNRESGVAGLSGGDTDLSRLAAAPDPLCTAPTDPWKFCVSD